MNALSNSWVGFINLAIFVLAYILIILESKLHLRKSKPVIFAGCLMWMLIALYEALSGGGHAEEHVKQLIGEIGELLLFILVAMTYINALQERLVFSSLRAWMTRKGFGYRTLFLVTGIITFFLSSVADNLTSALVMATVVAAVGSDNKRFLVPSLINIVVAANAGGAWTPFGDITSLMVWMAGKVATGDFVYIIFPSIINWGVSAAIMFPFIPTGNPSGSKERVEMKIGAKRIIFLGAATIAIAVSFHQFLHLPPVMGMMMGFGLLMFMGFYLKKQDKTRNKTSKEQFNIFRKVEQVEFDTLFFFFGIISAIGALRYIGYLDIFSHSIYGGLGNTFANIGIGVLSAVIDNIPLMYAVLQMNPPMGLDQWLLITLTTGTGGSLLSIGSAAGVGVMGVCKDDYTFISHLKWTPAVAAGYIAGIGSWWLITHWFM